MQHEIATVKKTIKRYTTKKGIEKESISSNVNLGSKSNFNDGDVVAVIPVDEIAEIDSADEVQKLEKGVADLNERVAILSAELEKKNKYIDDVTAKLDASEKTITNLESDISAKDNKIDDLTDDIKKAELTIDELKPLLISKDETIIDFEKQIAKYDAIDIDKLIADSEKLSAVADEKDKWKSVVIKLQSEKTEYIQLVAYKDKSIDALKHQNVLSKLIGKDATADIKLPVLKLIDESGNILKNSDDDVIDAENIDGSDDPN